MKNKEFYKDEIYEIACRRDCFAVNKKTGDVMRCKYTMCHDCLFNYLKGFSNCNNCDERAMEWLEQEHVEPILNDVEKRYLEAVLMPFKNRVLYVAKVVSNNSDKAYLEICIESLLEKTRREGIFLPFFHPEKMYVGMEKNRQYTIEELGLFADEEEDNEE